MAKIFDRPRFLRPTQMHVVAERRYEDAVALVGTRQNARANGAMYLAGFSIEILLKARMLKLYGSTLLQPDAPTDEAGRQRRLLFWRSHDLEAILEHLAVVEAAILKRPDGRALLTDLRTICGTWSIQARYSPASTTIAEAQRMINRVRRVKELLK